MHICIYIYISPPSSPPRKGKKIKQTKCLLVYIFFFYKNTKPLLSVHFFTERKITRSNVALRTNGGFLLI